MHQCETVQSLIHELHVLYAALNGLIEDGGNQIAREAVANLAGSAMNRAEQLATVLTVK